MINKDYKSGNSVTGYSFITDPVIRRNLDKIGPDDFVTGTHEVLFNLSAALQVDEVVLLSYMEFRKEFRYINSIKAEIRDLTEDIRSLEKSNPLFLKIFFEGGRLHFSGIDELPTEFKSDSDFFIRNNIISLMYIPLFSNLRNIYGMIAISSKVRNWTESDELILKQYGNTLVSLIERADLQEEISQSEKLFRTVANYTYDLESWHLTDGKLAFISHSCERITGYSQVEIMNDPDLFIKIVHPDDRTVAIRQWNEFMISRQNCTSRFRIITKSGETRWLEMIGRPVFDEDGNFNGYRSSSRDITDRIKLDEKIRFSEKKLIQIMQLQTDLICEFLPDGTILFANNPFISFFGLNNTNIEGKKFQSVINFGNQVDLMNLIDHILVDDPKVQFEGKMPGKDGSTVWQSWIVKGIFDESGKLLYFLSVGKDITDLKKTEILLEKALEEINYLKQQLEIENNTLKETTQSENSPFGIVTRNNTMLKVIERVKQVARSNSPVFITGEIGTGKKLLAKIIHDESDRKGKVMITLNCAAIPYSLIDSEIFGREKGNYTGIMTRQIGRLELANESTLFLDEVAELPVETQTKLMMVLQSGEFQALGSTVTRKVNVRIISASSRNLMKAIEEGTLRRDFFQKLSVYPIAVPPLRNRREDIPILVWKFLEEFSVKMGKRIKTLSRGSMDRLLAYSWPGNISELKNIVEFSMILTTSDTLKIHMHDESILQESKGETMEESERNHILRILAQTGWRVRGKGGAAEILGLKESTLRFRMKKLGISRK